MIARIVLGLLLLAPTLGLAQNSPLAEKLIASSPWEITIAPGRDGAPLTYALSFRMSAEGRLEVTDGSQWRPVEVSDDKVAKFRSNHGHAIAITRNSSGDFTATHSNSRATTFRSTR